MSKPIDMTKLINQVEDLLADSINEDEANIDE
jgi:hypothetical protein